MKTALALDIDNTLTPPRQPINKTMVEALIHLRAPFFVAAGSHLSLLNDQFFRPLYDHGFRGQFDAFLSNGAMRYHCDYSREMSVQLVSEFNLRLHLGESAYDFLIGKLNEAMEMKQLQPPAEMMVPEGKLVDRVSMINLCPIGRLNREDSHAQRNRERFVQFDQTTGYRERVLAHLNIELHSLITQKQLKITLGGQTSFDIGIIGEDKTKPVLVLIQSGFEKVVFIGDALFEGGNDAAINDLIRAWPSGSTCPVEAVQVNGWLETIEVFRRYRLLD